MSIFQHQELKTFRELLDEPTPASKWLLIVNVVLWFAAFAYGLYLLDYGGFIAPSPPPDQLVFTSGIKMNYLIKQGDWWRLITAMWVHLGILHLVFNAYGIYIIAPLIEKFYNTRRMFVIYMGSGLVGSIASFYFVSAPSGGASGALYGLIGATIAFGFKYRKNLPQELGKRLSMGMLPWVVLNIGIGFFDAVPFDNGAHLGGFISGIILGFIIPSRFNLPSKSKTFLVLAFVFLCLNIIAFLFWVREAWACLPDSEAFGSCYTILM